MPVYLLPVAYSFYTRIKSPRTIVSFFVTFFFPVVILSLSVTNGDLKTLDFILTFMALFLVYEIGYLFNDCHTTLYEESPTLRIRESVHEKLKVTYPIHIAVRIIIIFIIIQLCSGKVNVSNLMLCLICLNLSYSLHNYYRGVGNIFTIFLLMVFKYLTVPLSIYIVSGSWIYLLFFLLLIPTVRSFLFTTHNRINMGLLDKDKINDFRALYYLFSSVVIAILYFFENGFVYLLVLALVLFVFYAIPVFQKSRTS